LDIAEFLQATESGTFYLRVSSKMNMILNRQDATILPGAKLGALQRAPKGCAPGMVRIKVAKKGYFQ
jgi:hypothetical protein